MPRKPTSSLHPGIGRNGPSGRDSCTAKNCRPPPLTIINTKQKRPLRAAASPKCNQVSGSSGCDCSEAVLLPVYAKKPRPRKPAISIVQAWNTHDCPDQTAPRCYSQRGTCEQWIKEGKGAIKWTRLSCWTFASNAVRLQLHALAYNLGTNVPGDFAADRGTTAAATTRASVRRAMVTRSRATDWRSASKCQGKWLDRPLGHDSSCPRGWQPSTTSHLLQEGRKNANIHASSGAIRGIPA